MVHPPFKLTLFDPHDPNQLTMQINYDVDCETRHFGEQLLRRSDVCGEVADICFGLSHL